MSEGSPSLPGAFAGLHERVTGLSSGPLNLLSAAAVASDHPVALHLRDASGKKLGPRGLGTLMLPASGHGRVTHLLQLLPGRCQCRLCVGQPIFGLLLLPLVEPADDGH